MRKSIIAACDASFLIGVEGKLPWNLPADMKLFRQRTMGKPIIMGRLTYESLGKPLPGRTNIVLSRSSRNLPGCIVAHDLAEAFRIAEDTGTEECMVIGGGNVYEQAVWKVDRVYLTVIRHDFKVVRKRDGVYFPRDGWWDRRVCSVVQRVDHATGPDSPYEWSWFTIDLGPVVAVPRAAACSSRHARVSSASALSSPSPV